MPSFFQTMLRLAQGKPIFDTADTADKAEPAETPVAAGSKTPPRVCIERTEYHMNGSRMDYYADIHNDSGEEVEIDKVRLLGITRELDTRLRPGEKRQFLLYAGAMPQSEADVHCELDYRDATGDYFCGRHHLEYEARTPSGYPIRRIIYDGIKDI